MTHEEMMSRLRKWAQYQGLPSFTETIEQVLLYIEPKLETQVPNPDRYAALVHLKVLDSNRVMTDRRAAEKNLVSLYRRLGLNRKVPFSRVGHPSEFTGYRNVIHKITKPVSYARRHLTWYWVFGPNVCARVPHLPKLCKVANDRGMI